MKIYIAGPFFSEREKKLINIVIDIAKKNWPDAELFIPMEHFIIGGETMPNSEWAKKVREMDIEAIKECDIILALYYGHYSDTGTVFEIGYGSALGKEIYIANLDTTTSLMVTSSGKNLWLHEENKSLTEFNERQLNLIINQK